MTLTDTIPMMTSDDYRERFFAEYAQAKIRYEKLKDLCTRIDAARMIINPAMEPEHDCPLELLKDQQAIMGKYLHILELRAVIEHIDLSMMEV